MKFKKLKNLPNYITHILYIVAGILMTFAAIYWESNKGKAEDLAIAASVTLTASFIVMMLDIFLRTKEK